MYGVAVLSTHGDPPVLFLTLAVAAYAASSSPTPGTGAKLVAVKAAIEQIKTAASAVESALATTCPAS